MSTIIQAVNSAKRSSANREEIQRKPGAHHGTQRHALHRLAHISNRYTYHREIRDSQRAERPADKDAGHSQQSGFYEVHRHQLPLFHPQCGEYSRFPHAFKHHHQHGIGDDDRHHHHDNAINQRVIAHAHIHQLQEDRIEVSPADHRLVRIFPCRHE